MSTVNLIVAPEQVDKLIHDLRQSIRAGAGSILLITCSTDEEDDVMALAMTAYETGQGTISLLPEPDLICHTSIWTVALPIPVDELITHARAWSDQND